MTYASYATYASTLPFHPFRYILGLRLSTITPWRQRRRTYDSNHKYKHYWAPCTGLDKVLGWFGWSLNRGGFRGSFGTPWSGDHKSTPNKPFRDDNTLSSPGKPYPTRPIPSYVKGSFFRFLSTIWQLHRDPNSVYMSKHRIQVK